MPEQITCKLFPTHARYGPQAGKENEAFLDAGMLKEMFLRPLWPHREKTAVLIFEFGAFGQQSFAERGEFLDRLDPFLARAAAGVPLRGGDPQSGVSGQGLLRLPAQPRRGARVQRVVADAGTAAADGHPGFGDGRFPGVPRAAAARAGVRRSGEAFAPYTEIQDPNPEARDSMRVLIGRARENKQFLFLFVNNRLEGNAPMTIMAVTEP